MTILDKHVQRYQNIAKTEQGRQIDFVQAKNELTKLIQLAELLIAPDFESFFETNEYGKNTSQTQRA